METDQKTSKRSNTCGIFHFFANQHGLASVRNGPVSPCEKTERIRHCQDFTECLHSAVPPFPQPPVDRLRAKEINDGQH
jgi:hypothetical protein